MTEKKYKIVPEKIKKLINTDIGCIASDMITINGEMVGYMYRETSEDTYDSGWRFFSGKEDQAYADNAAHFAFYKINTIANYDPAIIPYIDYPTGSNLVRRDGTSDFELKED